MGALLVVAALLAPSGGEPELASLVARLGHASQGERNAIVERLRYLDHPRTRTALERLSASPGEGERAAAASAIGALGLRAAAGAVVALLDDPDPEVRRSAAEALGHLGPPAGGLAGLARAAAGNDRALRAAAVASLARSPSPAATRALAGLARDPRLELRLAALRSLCSRNAARADLRRALGDPASGVRLLAGRCLAEQRDVRGFAYLERVLVWDQDRQARRLAAELLGRAPGRGAAEALVRALGDEDATVRRLAATSLARRGDARGRRWLELHATEAGAEP